METKRTNVTKDGLTEGDLKLLVRGGYDVQKLRISAGNRVCAQFFAKMGQEPGMKQEDIPDSKKQTMLAQVRKEFDKITEGAAKSLRNVTFLEDGVISNSAELFLVAEWSGLRHAEDEQFNRIKRLVRDFPLWKSFFKDVYGVGEIMAGVIMSEIDIHKDEYPSSVWAYCGLDIGPDGRGRGKYTEHLVDYEYLDKDKQKQTRKGITFNPHVKSKLLGVLAGSFLRAKSKAKSGQETYADIYYSYKNRIENMPAHEEKSKGHRHNMANRYMIKMFLVDVYVAWRTLENLPVSNTYAEGKLGIVHGKAS